MASEDRYAAYNNIDSTDRDINSAGWIYSEKDSWDKANCGFPRGVDSDNVGHWSAIGIHRQMPPSCARGYTQMGSGLMKCQTDGEWTNNVRCVPYGEYDGHSYLLVPDAVSWDTAKERCERYGGYLAEVESIEENNWITQTLVAPYYANSSADWWLLSSWIGANDLTEEGTFVWSTSGNHLNYTNWLSGQPDNFLGNENCVQVTNNGIWNDMGCGLPIPFLCKATAFWK
ncbi:alpha-N-acetylgalactosamine-specific lectin-like [Saccostrea cucullata]|uniref:alpha-N-acetylgalactosamine-specific lectin-like n=1 Tax=Saccostrea cuccullata TaxID=36930 RepID=UPI002ED41572